jgi:hypothetical protein
MKKYPSIGQCCLHNINFKHLLSGDLNFKTNNKNNKFGIWDLKLKIKIKLSKAFLELTDCESFFIHGIV